MPSLFAILVSFLVLVFQAKATVVLPVSLEEMAKKADIIVRGVCEEKRKETIPRKVPEQPIPPIPVSVCVFRVVETLKGNLGSRLEVKQPDLSSRREAFHLGLLGLFDTTPLELGKEYVLFLGPTVPELGFRWVIGRGGQGKFEILKDAGKEKVVNAFSNRALFQNFSQQEFHLSKSEQALTQAPPGPLPYEEFASIIRKVLGQ